jgi:hypothetical protein
MIMDESISGSFSDCEYPGLYTYEPSPFVRFHDDSTSTHSHDQIWNHCSHEISVPLHREIEATKRVSLKDDGKRSSRYQVVMGTDGRLHRVMRREWLKQGRTVLFVSSMYDEIEDDLSILQSDAFDNEEEGTEDNTSYP